MWVVDRVIVADQIYTMNQQTPRATWLAIDRGVVVAFGGPDATPPASRQTDVYSGATVVPGFHDAHCHTMWFGLSLGQIDASQHATLDSLYQALAERAGTLPPGDWVLATGYNQERFGGAYPDIDVLDHLLPDRPLLMRHTSGHACIVNSVALRAAGLDRGDVEVSGGVVGRDGDGNPTGVLEERAQTIVQELLLPVSIDQMVQAVGRASQRYSQEGITSFAETGIAGGWIGHSPRELSAYQRARREGQLAQRAQLMVVSDVLHPLGGHPKDPMVRGLDAGMASGLGDDWLALGPMKIFLDGSMLAWTGAMSEPFSAGPPDNCGYFQDDPEVLRQVMLEAAAAGWAIGAHAIGDRAVGLALETFAEALSRFGPPPMPHRIEHGGVVTAEQVTQAAALGVAIVTQPGFMPELGVQMRQAMGPHREALIHRHQSLLDAGGMAAGSSDRPVATGVPLEIIQSMVLRLDAEGVIVGPDERVSVATALWTYTVGSAQVTGTDQRRGQLVPGMLADCVVLGADPLATSPDRLSEITIRATIIDGQVVFGGVG